MPNESTPVLSVEGLTKTIGSRTIVDRISFEVNPGEIFGFLGPNGAGKTTTIRMLVGLIRPTAGSIHIAGHDLQNDFLRAIRHVGCIVENPEMYPYLTGRENLEIFARMQGDVSAERIEEVVRLVELEHRIDDRVNTYSLGMRQRLGIAQALLGRPSLLILDEPTNGLDPAGIRELRAFVRQLAKTEGISVFISSHILHEVQLMCDRVAIIHQGRLVKTGTVQQLLDGYPRVEWHLRSVPKGEQVLSSLPDVVILDTSEDGSVLTQMPEERIAQANRALLEAGVDVVGIEQKRPTLEDLFLETTEGSHIA
ncbi:ABC transporter ATP-binding protein [Polycladomyces subterraneus]|uniref:ABC transporter ATP-binding protein n=1 Tax=Polycladomyces subterraneus TaxID=1016997 RepID=A0ABT8IMB4_9BACL|nr:ABC transporter ATP-binding protein [Polycladomyces subterraneus]MDN4593906.1 ABC transporter ATP-binding protein [Polycladomyces subterraneus]